MKRPIRSHFVFLFVQSFFFELSLFALPAIETTNLKIDPSFQTLVGMQRGTNINFGLGALDSVGETERSTLYVAMKPKFTAEYLLPESILYGGFSFVAATTTLDGEISGQIARSGDEAFDTDHAYLGWRKGVIDFSVGGQEFAIGDGFIVGDGNFNKGGENGQYWTGAFLSWRNSAILRVDTEPLRGDLFWLRTDSDFKDGRVIGLNVEHVSKSLGTVGFTYLSVLEGDAFNLRGMRAWSFRVADLMLPQLPNLKVFGEWVTERGNDKQGGGRKNRAFGWYIEGQYSFPNLMWKPKIGYRYVDLSGDKASTPENEEYRGLYYTIFKRDWDTWYQGEIAGEYHLFNQNQETQMFKIKLFPAATWAVTLYYYTHELSEPHYFATQVSNTDWAKEINFGVEKFISDRFYGYVGVAWSNPDAAAKEVFGDKDFTVVQTYLSFTF